MDDNADFFVGFLVWGVFWVVIGAVVGRVIGAARNNPKGGLMLGAILGPIGWLLAFFSDDRPECPQCKNRVQPGARICPHCGFVPGGDGRSEIKVPSIAAEDKQCPFCAETIKKAAIKCRYCGSDLSAQYEPAQPVSCPLCNQGISRENIVTGENFCPACGGTFIAET